MFCPECGKEVKVGARFCSECGWEVPVQNAQPVEQCCASCGTVLKEGAKFCPNCGEPVSAVPDVPASVPPSTDTTPTDTPAKEEVDGETPEQEEVETSEQEEVEPPEQEEVEPPEQEEVVIKSNAIDKAVFYHLGSRIYACHLYKDGAVVGNMTDTQGAFIPDVKEWLEKKYDNLIVEIKEEK